MMYSAGQQQQKKIVIVWREKKYVPIAREQQIQN